MSNEGPIHLGRTIGSGRLAIGPIDPNLTFFELSHGVDGGDLLAIAGWDAGLGRIAIGIRLMVTTDQMKRMAPCAQPLKQYFRI